MYRGWSAPKIYCPLISCDRTCGLFHKFFIDITYKQQLVTSSEELTDDTSEKADNFEHDHDELNTNLVNVGASVSRVFEEIMESAARKVSPSFVHPPLPPLPEGISPRKRQKTLVRSDTQGEDTTTIHYDKPIWDDEEFRHILFESSDEEDFLEVDPPSILDDEDTSIEALIKIASLDKYTNPIEHETGDMNVFVDSDKDDYSMIDLTAHRKFSVDSLSGITVRRDAYRRAEYEQSLDVS